MRNSCIKSVVIALALSLLLPTSGLNTAAAAGVNPVRNNVSNGVNKKPSALNKARLKARKLPRAKAASAKKKAMRKAPAGLKLRQQQLRGQLKQKQLQSREFLRQLEQKQ